MVGGADVRLEEQEPGVLVGPVVRDGVFLLGVFLDVFDDVLEGAVFFDEVEGGGGADLGDGVDVVAAEEDAEVDELERNVSFRRPWEGG